MPGGHPDAWPAVKPIFQVSILCVNQSSGVPHARWQDYIVRASRKMME